MPGIEISALPAATSANLTDVFPSDQLPGPVTRKISLQQVLDLFSDNFVEGVTGTTNQIDVNNTDPINPILSISSTLIAPGTAQVGNLLLDTNTISKYKYLSESFIYKHEKHLSLLLLLENKNISNEIKKKYRYVYY